MKSQDIVLLLKLISLEQSSEADMSESYSLRRLETLTGISKSELSAALNRCIDSGLAAKDRHSGLPRVNRKALLGFLREGIKYVYPVRPGAVVRGMPTAFAAPGLKGKLMSAGELIPVWPNARSKDKGLSVTPLFRSVPEAASQDTTLYRLLALVDAIRIGNARESAVAAQVLKEAFRL